MKILIKNCTNVLWLCLNLLRWVGFLVPDELTGYKKILYPFYFSFWFMFIVGIFIISEFVAFVQVWGEVSEMTGIVFVLFTNLAFVAKIYNVMQKKNTVQAIIDEGDSVLNSERRAEGRQIVNRMNKETTRLLCMYTTDALIIFIGWVASAGKNRQLPYRAWYPFDTSKSPAYELAFIHQIAVMIGGASLNISLDQLVTTLTAVCRCRFQLVNLSLRTLCKDISTTDKLIAVEEEVVKLRLHRCVLQHQAALLSAAQIQECFTATILGQFTVSILIICATAYQLAEETRDNILWLIPTAFYFMAMIMQVYFYCNEAHKLTEESSLIADAVYECPWYLCSVSLRRALLIVMVRSRRITVLTAGGFTTLSLTCFVSIIRVSYSFFTVLKQMEH